MEDKQEAQQEVQQQPQQKEVTTGHVVCLVYEFRRNRYTEIVKPFTLTKKGRLGFNYHPAIFSGMKAESIGQFHYDKHDREARMVLIAGALVNDTSRLLFFKSVLKRSNALNKAKIN